jgi:hypothetical protein
MRNVLILVTVLQMLNVKLVIIEAFAPAFQIIEAILTLKAVNQFLNLWLKSKIVDQMLTVHL